MKYDIQDTRNLARRNMLRKKILSILHRTEGDDEFMKVHKSPPNQCDMDLAAPRCAKRVKAIEKLIQDELDANQVHPRCEGCGDYMGGYCGECKRLWQT